MRIYGFTEYGGPEVEGFLDAPDPVASTRAVLVRMRAAGLNPADLKVRSGQRQGTVEVRFPMALGREAAGAVVRDPSGRFRAGELVFGSCASGFGALGDLVLLVVEQTARVPEGATPEQAACIPVAIETAWDALAELEVGPGDTVLILGAGGGVGVHAVQLARHLGARVIGVAGAGKAELVASAGAEHVPSGPGWNEAVAALAPEGVDAVIDAVGGDTVREAATLLRDPGQIRSSAAPALASELGGSGITRRRDAGVYAELAELVARGVIQPVIHTTYPLSEAAAAVATVASGHATGKTVITAATTHDLSWRGDKRGYDGRITPICRLSMMRAAVSPRRLTSRCRRGGPGPRGRAAAPAAGAGRAASPARRGPRPGRRGARHESP